MCYQTLCTAIVEVEVVDPFAAPPFLPPTRGLSRQEKEGWEGGGDRPAILVSPPFLPFLVVVQAWLREEQGGKVESSEYFSARNASQGAAEAPQHGEDGGGAVQVGRSQVKKISSLRFFLNISLFAIGAL